MRAALLALALLVARPVPPPVVFAGEAEEPPEVYASFYPLAFLAQRIGGADLRVLCPVPAGADPASWLPARELVARMQEADLVLVHGAGLERWPDLVSLPLARTVVTTRPFRDRLRPFAAGVRHSHGEQGAPAHAGPDPHTWLDPDLALEEARVVLATLEARFPARADACARRFAQLLAEVAVWRAEVERLSAALADELLVAAHPSYDYLARHHGWRVENVALEPGARPDGESLERLRALRAAGARLVLWEAPPAESVRRVLAGEGLASVVYSPCEALDPERLAAGTDFLGLMRENAQRLRAALRGPR